MPDMTRLRSVSAIVFALQLVSITAQSSVAQTPAAGQIGTLAITGDVAQPMTLSPGDLRAMPRTTVKATDHGTTLTYEGVMVGELLKRAGAPVGEALRGKALATYVLASATDGYQVVFSLGELDPALSANDIIVADRVHGKPLPPDHGTLRIVVPKDTRGARSICMLERIEVVRLRK